MVTLNVLLEALRRFWYKYRARHYLGLRLISSYLPTNIVSTINMHFIIAIVFLTSVVMAADVSVSQSGGSYNFGYNTGTGQSRQESGSAGNVAGSYSYIDANGDSRTVHYTAGPNGYQATGDTGVDKKTAAAAAAMAALAPKAPPAHAPAVPVAPIFTPWYHYGHVGHAFIYANPGLAGYMAHW